jgi:hypothetical protein
MKRYVTLLILALTLAFVATTVAAAEMEYVPLSKLGIKVPVRNLYTPSKEGRSYTGTVVDPGSVGQENIFDQAYRGEKLDVTYLGNGQVKLRKVESGEEVLLDVRHYISVPVQD